MLLLVVVVRLLMPPLLETVSDTDEFCVDQECSVEALHLGLDSMLQAAEEEVLHDVDQKEVSG